MYVFGSHRGHRRHWTSWKRCYWQLWATMWVLGTEPRPSVRASMAKQSPSSRFGFLNLGFSMWFWLASNSWSFFLPQPLELGDYRQAFPSQDKYVLLLLEVFKFLLFVFSLFSFFVCVCVLFCFETGSHVAQASPQLYVAKDDLELLILQPPSLPSVGNYRDNTFMGDFSRYFWKLLFWNHFLWNSSRKETCDRRDLESSFKLFETTELLATEAGVWPGVPRTQSLAWAPCGPSVFTNRFGTCFHVK